MQHGNSPSPCCHLGCAEPRPNRGRRAIRTCYCACARGSLHAAAATAAAATASAATATGATATATAPSPLTFVTPVTTVATQGAAATALGASCKLPLGNHGPLRVESAWPGLRHDHEGLRRHDGDPRSARWCCVAPTHGGHGSHTERHFRHHSRTSAPWECQARHRNRGGGRCHMYRHSYRHTCCGGVHALLPPRPAV